MAAALRCAIGSVGYLAAFVFLTWPLVRHAGSQVPARFGPDLEHSLWVQWWFATALGSPGHALFHTRMVDFPHEVDLQLADLNLLVNAAFYAASRVLSLAASWNLLLLASFLLAGGLTWRLCTRLGASPAAGWIAGLFFAGSPYWLASALNGWCYLVHTWTLPLVALAALSLRDAPGLRSGAWLGTSLALAFHVTPYYLLYAGVLLLVLVLLRGPLSIAWGSHARTGGAWAAVGVVAVLLVAPRALAMGLAASRELVVHHGPLNTALSLPLVELFWPSQAAVTSRLPRLGYLVGFVGWTLLGTLVVGAACAGRSALAGARSWLIAAGVMLLLALGPRVALSYERVTSIPLPGALLQRLPGFAMTTNHWRWVLPASLCLSVALAFAVGALTRRLAGLRPALGHALVPLLALAWASEVAWVWPLPFPRPLWQVQASPVAALLRDRDDVHAVLDRTDRRKLNQTLHGKPIVLGWLPRIDRETQRANEAMVAECGGRGPACLREHGIDAVIQDDRTALLLDEDGGVRQVLIAPQPR